MSTAVQPHPQTGKKQRSYTLEEKERGMTELALCRGNFRLAAKQLRAKGYDYPAETVRKWRTYNADRYQEIAATQAEQIEKRMVVEFRESASLAGEVERAALDASLKQLQAGEARDPSSVAKNVSIVKGVNVTKVLELSGRPTQIVEHRSADELLRGLAQRIPGMVVNSSAEEITDADVEIPDVERDGKVLALAADGRPQPAPE